MDPTSDTQPTLSVDTGSGVVRLTDLGRRVPELIRLLPGLGTLALETSSTGAVSEVVATYDGVRLAEKTTALLEQRHASVRLRLDGIAFARAVRDAGQALETGHRIDFVDAGGAVAHRVRLQRASRITDFEDLVASVRSCPGPEGPPPPAMPRRRVARGTGADELCADGELREAWCSAVDDKDVVAIAGDLGISRGRLWRAVDDEWAAPVSPDVVALVATRAAMRSIPVAVTVGNEMCTQTWRSTIAVACPAPQALALVGCHCRALLRHEPSQSCWRVKRPNGAALSLEVLDSRGVLVLALALGDAVPLDDQEDFSDLRAAWVELFDDVAAVPTLQHVSPWWRRELGTQ